MEAGPHGTCPLPEGSTGPSQTIRGPATVPRLPSLREGAVCAGRGGLAQTGSRWTGTKEGSPCDGFIGGGVDRGWRGGH